jgi:hypothetical protein
MGRNQKTTDHSATRSPAIRDRIKELRRVKASDLKPNPRNWRTHPASQRSALEGVLSEIGYADALLARELPDGSLELVDGHLRAETTPDQEVPVLVLDVDEAEANKILATLDPLAALAIADDAQLTALLKSIETSSEPIRSLLADLTKDMNLSLGEACGNFEHAADADDTGPVDFPERFEVLVTCEHEPQQQALIERLLLDGFECRALIS